jgi:ABC-type Fe3+-hydroxamate transport system substrate-binding protein
MGHLRHTFAAATLALLAPLAACGSNDDVATDPATSTATSTSPSGTPSSTPGAYPTVAATDYTYRLQVLCYCPLVGPVEVTVRDGAVRSATVVGGVAKGRPAPAYTHKTINDLVAIANDAKAGQVKVTWPAGAKVPQRITVSPVRRTTDATITYVISAFSEG